MSVYVSGDAAPARPLRRGSAGGAASLGDCLQAAGARLRGKRRMGFPSASGDGLSLACM